MGVSDAVLVELRELNREVKTDEWERWMTYPTPKPREFQEDDYDDDDDTSVGSSEPEGDYQWNPDHVPSNHPVHTLINATLNTPQPSVTTQLKESGLSITLPQWNAYLVATAIEESIFQTKGGKTEAYHAYVKTIRAELKNKYSSLKTRLLRHIMPPEKLVTLVPTEICSKFRK
eukprot:TRINITY_DN33461_c0_g1_i1.p2 TRINITY_DN33461_c0_g1~~TRINITY_DN33461_c0_g1_i1.p2  ORF type:complete len:201 (+),score=50.00 TRINITY_DN33461_c0_g1_i1:84-605(+)